MRFVGRVFKAGRHWAIEVPILGVVTQGRTRKDAFAMIADAIEALANQENFRVEVFPGIGEYFEVGSPNVAGLTALLLRRQRVRRGLTLAEAEASAVVYGMPLAAVETGAVDEVLALTDLAPRLVRFARGE